jgi:hypothetical protein
MQMQASIFLLLTLSLSLAARADPAADEAARKFLASKENPESEESGESRGAARADLDGDGADEIVVVWTLLGPTYWRNHLSVLRKSAQGYAEAATAGLNGEAELEGVRGGVVSVKQTAFAPDDPRCCPSEGKTLRYRWKNGEIVPLP